MLGSKQEHRIAVASATMAAPLFLQTKKLTMFRQQRGLGVVCFDLKLLARLTLTRLWVSLFSSTYCRNLVVLYKSLTSHEIFSFPSVFWVALKLNRHCAVSRDWTRTASLPMYHVLVRDFRNIYVWPKSGLRSDLWVSVLQTCPQTTLAAAYLHTHWYGLITFKMLLKPLTEIEETPNLMRNAYL